VSRPWENGCPRGALLLAPDTHTHTLNARCPAKKGTPVPGRGDTPPFMNVVNGVRLGLATDMKGQFPAMTTSDDSPDAEASGPETGRGGFMSFWGSLPGVLTALAGLVTAVSGIYFASARGPQDPQPPPTTQASAVSSDAPVVVPVLISPSELQTVQVDEPALRDPLDGCADGNIADCERLIEELVADCDYGDPDACNVLYELSPVGSDLEDFGGTCGYRLDDWTYAGECELYL
jgi:hypothetical protein